MDDELDILNYSTKKIDINDIPRNQDSNIEAVVVLDEHQEEEQGISQDAGESVVQPIELDIGDGTFIYASVLNGELTGECKLIKNEQNVAVLLYDQGLLHGLCTFYQQDGAISAKVNYKLGNKEGTSSYYNESGSLLKTEDYVNNKKHGISKTYYDSSELYEEIEYDNDQVISCIRYNKDGSLLDN